MTLRHIKHTVFGWKRALIIGNIVLLFFILLKHRENIHCRTLSIWNQHEQLFQNHVVSELFKWYASEVRSGPSYCHLNSVSKPDNEVRSHARHLAERAEKRNSSRSAHYCSFYDQSTQDVLSQGEHTKYQFTSESLFTTHTTFTLEEDWDKNEAWMNRNNIN